MIEPVKIAGRLDLELLAPPETLVLLKILPNDVRRVLKPLGQPVLD